MMNGARTQEPALTDRKWVCRSHLASTSRPLPGRISSSGSAASDANVNSNGGCIFGRRLGAGRRGQLRKLGHQTKRINGACSRAPAAQCRPFDSNGVPTTRINAFFNSMQPLSDAFFFAIGSLGQWRWIHRGHVHSTKILLETSAEIQRTRVRIPINARINAQNP